MSPNAALLFWVGSWRMSPCLLFPPLFWSWWICNIPTLLQASHTLMDAIIHVIFSKILKCRLIPVTTCTCNCLTQLIKNRIHYMHSPSCKPINSTLLLFVLFFPFFFFLFDFFLKQKCLRNRNVHVYKCKSVFSFKRKIFSLSQILRTHALQKWNLGK